MNKNTPKWFQDWHSNEFFHLCVSVKTNKRLITALVAIGAAILIRVLVG